jgi:hypothetical protein
MSSLSIIKSKQQHALADRIQRIGIEMPSCSRCEKRGLKCLVAPDTSRCGECVRSKVKCDVLGPSSADWERFNAEEDRLNDEEAKTTAVLAEAAAKLARLQQQKKSLRTRARDMLCRGVKTLDELDELEAREREEQERRNLEAPPPIGPFLTDTVDLSEVLGLDQFDPDPSFWASLGFGGGTPQVSQGN